MQVPEVNGGYLGDLPNKDGQLKESIRGEGRDCVIGAMDEVGWMKGKEKKEEKEGETRRTRRVRAGKFNRGGNKGTQKEMMDIPRANVNRSGWRSISCISREMTWLAVS